MALCFLHEHERDEKKRNPYWWWWLSLKENCLRWVNHFSCCFLIRASDYLSNNKFFFVSSWGMLIISSSSIRLNCTFSSCRSNENPLMVLVDHRRRCSSEWSGCWTSQCKQQVDSAQKETSRNWDGRDEKSGCLPCVAREIKRGVDYLSNLTRSLFISFYFFSFAARAAPRRTHEKGDSSCNVCIYIHIICIYFFFFL